jgi:hypothetical protein
MERIKSILIAHALRIRSAIYPEIPLGTPDIALYLRGSEGEVYQERLEANSITFAGVNFVDALRAGFEGAIAQAALAVRSTPRLCQDISKYEGEDVRPLVLQLIRNLK